MRDIKEKYDDYKTPFDETAWDHFNMIRSNEKPKRRIIWWPLFGAIILLSSFSIAYYFYAENYSSNAIEASVKHQEELKSTSILASDQKNILSESLTTHDSQGNESLEKNKDQISVSENEIVRKKTQAKVKKARATKKEIVNPVITPRTNFLTENKESLYNKQSSPISFSKINFDTKDSSIKPVDKSSIKKTFDLNKSSLHILSFSPLQTKTSLLQHLRELDLDMDRTLINKTKVIKPINNKNNLKLSFNYADFYVNGSIGGVVPGFEQIEKRGYLFQLEYYRNLNKILAVGASVGYSFGNDINNRWQPLLDYEKIKYAHLNLYLFLLNDQKNKLFFKAGSGITNTDRLHSFFIIRPEGNSRGLQQNNLTDRGLLVEFSYSRYLNKNLFISLNYGVITHNDGAWFLGSSIGYSF